MLCKLVLILSRYKTIIGRKLRSKDADNQNTEVQIGVRILNRMRALAYPKADVLHKISSKLKRDASSFLLCNSARIATDIAAEHSNHYHKRQDPP